MFQVIDRLFDKFESRTCENCKYCKEDSNETAVWIECRCKNSPMEYNSLISDDGYPSIIDFGCSEFKRKIT